MRLWISAVGQIRFKLILQNWQKYSKTLSRLSRLKGANALNFLGGRMWPIWLRRNAWDLAVNLEGRLIRGNYFDSIPNHISSTILRETLAHTPNRSNTTN